MILIRFTAVWISHVIPIEQRIEIKLNVMQKCNFALHSADHKYDYLQMSVVLTAQAHLI